MFTYSIWDFSDKEIDQIVEIVKEWGTGSSELFNGHGALDRRKISKQVFKWAKSRYLIQQGSEILTWRNGDFEHPYYVQRGGINRWYSVSSSTDRRFDARYDMPQEAIWRMLEPIFEQGKGHWTITNSSVWRQFGIWCASDREWNRKEEIEGKKHLTLGEARYIPFIKDVLNVLEKWGYIWFQYAGSVWQVTLTPERAIRSE